jgi:potassium-transporting ATPase KdpC subunit
MYGKSSLMKTNSAGLIAVRSLVVLTLLCGGIYPGLITIAAKIFWPALSQGDLFIAQDRVAGAKLVAQSTPARGYFQPRPSACGYNTLPGSASNYAPSSAALRDSAAARRMRFRRENGLADTTRVPADMLFSSASGLDPHISPAAARLQINRIAVQRQLNAKQRKQLAEAVERTVEHRQLGFLGEPRINVVELNYLLYNSNGFDNLKEKQ